MDISILNNALAAAIGLDTVIYALAALGLNIQFGYAGLLNFGQAAFVAMGAYGVGISVTYLDAPLWVGFVVGIAVLQSGGLSAESADDAAGFNGWGGWVFRLSFVACAAVAPERVNQ